MNITEAAKEAAIAENMAASDPRTSYHRGHFVQALIDSTTADLRAEVESNKIAYNTVHEFLKQRASERDAALSSLEQVKRERDNALVYKEKFSACVKACSFIQYEAETLDLQLGASITTDGVLALKAQRDALRKQVEIDTECIERIRKHGMNLELQLLASDSCLIEALNAIKGCTQLETENRLRYIHSIGLTHISFRDGAFVSTRKEGDEPCVMKSKLTATADAETRVAPSTDASSNGPADGPIPPASGHQWEDGICALCHSFIDMPSAKVPCRGNIPVPQETGTQTPRTDAFAHQMSKGWHPKMGNWPDFARTLEDDLLTAQQRIEALERERDALILKSDDESEYVHNLWLESLSKQELVTTYIKGETAQETVSAICARIRDRFDKLTAELEEAKKDSEESKKRLSMARMLVIKHHDSSLRQRPGCFCPVCSSDGTDKEYDAVFNTPIDSARKEPK